MFSRREETTLRKKKVKTDPLITLTRIANEVVDGQLRKSAQVVQGGFTAVGQVVACAPVMQRARVRSPVGSSFLG